MGACHYPFRANPHSFAGRGSDRRQERAALEPSQAERRAWRIAPAAAFAGVRDFRKSCTASALSAGARPERHAQGFGLDLAMPAAWAALPPLHPHLSFVPPVSIEPDVYGRLGDVENPPQSGQQRTRFDPYRVRTAPQERPPSRELKRISSPKEGRQVSHISQPGQRDPRRRLRLLPTVEHAQHHPALGRCVAAGRLAPGRIEATGEPQSRGRSAPPR